MSIELIVWVVCLAFNITMVLSFVLKGSESKFMSRLLTSQAFDEETSRSLSDLKIDGRLIKFLLRDGSTLRKVVTLVGGNNNRLALQKGAKAKMDFEKAKFYIAQGNMDRAKSMQKSAVKWYLLPVFCALSVGIAIGIHFLIPVVINW